MKSKKLFKTNQNNSDYVKTGTTTYSSTRMIEREEDTFKFDDGAIIKVLSYSVFPMDNIDDIHLMNIYGQKIYNKYKDIQERRV